MSNDIPAAQKPCQKRQPGVAHAIMFFICIAALAITDVPAFAAKYLQCVPFARDVSGVQIYGDAHTWWRQAAGKYDRGQKPKVGSVMSFKSTSAMPLGHIAVVSKIKNARELLISHANWSPINGRRGQIERNVLVRDVSDRNDWSAVRVWYAPTQDLGVRINPLNGFIYPVRPGRDFGSDTLPMPKKDDVPATKLDKKALKKATKDKKAADKAGRKAAKAAAETARDKALSDAKAAKRRTSDAAAKRPAAKPFMVAKPAQTRNRARNDWDESAAPPRPAGKPAVNPTGKPVVQQRAKPVAKAQSPGIAQPPVKSGKKSATPDLDAVMARLNP